MTIHKKLNYAGFREQIVPYMQKVVYYPDTLDIFGVSCVGGISIYLVGKSLVDKTVVTNVQRHQKLFNGQEIRDIKNRKQLINIGNEINTYLKDSIKFKPDSIDKDKTYKVVTNSQIVLCGANSTQRKQSDAVGRLSSMFNSAGKCTFIGEPDVATFLRDGAYGVIFSSDSELECNYFKSWLNCKFTRFFVGINISKLGPILNDDCFRFVPAPPSGKFDHVYTDEELYKAFNLPQKYIDVIEAVVAERK